MQLHLASGSTSLPYIRKVFREKRTDGRSSGRRGPPLWKRSRRMTETNICSEESTSDPKRSLGTTPTLLVALLQRFQSVGLDRCGWVGGWYLQKAIGDTGQDSCGHGRCTTRSDRGWLLWKRGFTIGRITLHMFISAFFYTYAICLPNNILYETVIIANYVLSQNIIQWRHTFFLKLTAGL